MLAKKIKNRKKKSVKDLFFSFLILIFIFAIIGFLFFSNLKINRKRAELAKTIEGLEKEFQFLKERNEQLKSGIFQIETDDYWEAKLYEQGFKKPGEEAIIIIPPEKEKEAKDTERSEEEKNFWKNLLETFGF